MSNDIFVLVEHRDGAVAESAYELLGRARELAAATSGAAVALVAGAAASMLASQLGAASRVIAVEDASLAEFTPAAWQAALAPLIAERQPLLLLVPNSGSGMDVAAGLSAATGLPLAAYAVDVAIAGGSPTVTCQLYAGKINVRVRFDGGRGIATVVAGAFPAPAAAHARIRFRRLIRPEAGGVDITKESILVSIGRGIGEADNVELAERLAAALGGAVSSSRPVADAGWLPRTRQVGKSGLRVKPKLYLALGISGAPEHLEGMRDAELIVAVNTDAHAPIFGVAHYGAVADILEVMPALTQRLGG